MADAGIGTPIWSTLPLPREPPHVTASQTLLIIASHPSERFRVLALQRMVSCVPASAAIVSVSKGYEKVARDAVVSMHLEGVHLVPEQTEQSRDHGPGMSVRIVTSSNNRYDTGKWCTALQADEASWSSLHKNHSRTLPHSRYKYFILANDSVYMLRMVPELLSAIGGNRFDMVGTVRHTVGMGNERGPHFEHLPSFLRFLTRSAVGTWAKYSCQPPGHASFASKASIIGYHEIGSSQLFERDRMFAPVTMDGWHINGSRWGMLVRGEGFTVNSSSAASSRERAARASAAFAGWPHFTVAKELDWRWWCPVTSALILFLNHHLGKEHYAYNFGVDLLLHGCESWSGFPQCLASAAPTRVHAPTAGGGWVHGASRRRPASTHAAHTHTATHTHNSTHNRSHGSTPAA